MKKITAIALIFALICMLSACGKQQAAPSPSPTAAADISQLKADPVGITITLEDGRSIKANLYPKLAPITVENFTKLCNTNFYDGLIFHRVINGFMIQGGGMDKSGIQKQTDTIKGEFKQNGVDNPLSHKRGVLSMARTALSMDSASSQFFIVQADSTHLDGQYAAFGEVTEGMDVVDEIAAVQTDSNDAPTEPIVIKSITVD
mgnify:CR=1 FL=1